MKTKKKHKLVDKINELNQSLHTYVLLVSRNRSSDEAQRLVDCYLSLRNQIPIGECNRLTTVINYLIEKEIEFLKETITK